MKNLIYRFTNKANGKVYIGLTTQGFIQRVREHLCRFTSGERNHKLYQALRKYGWDNFEREVIFCTFKEEDLPYYEEHFIEEYNSFNRGYNMTCGDVLVSSETKEKIRAKHLGRKITWYDKILATKKARGVYKTGAGNHLAKSYLVKGSDGVQFKIDCLSEFARSVDASNLLKTLGKNKHCRGYSVVARFNDYPEREYTQASGNAEYLGFSQGKDIVCSS